MFAMNLSLIVELVLSVLLLATIVYCALLERRLAALRSGQDGLKATIAQLNEAIVSASSSMRMLKTAAGAAAETLNERIARGRSLADELALLTATGDRIADRIAERGSAPLPAKNGSTEALPAMLGARLQALKPQALRNVR